MLYVSTRNRYARRRIEWEIVDYGPRNKYKGRGKYIHITITIAKVPVGKQE